MTEKGWRGQRQAGDPPRTGAARGPGRHVPGEAPAALRLREALERRKARMATAKKK